MVQPADARAETATATLLTMASGYQLTQLLGVAATLGIADQLTEGPRLPSELAVVTGTHAAALYRFLRALASHGVFSEDEAGRFALTALAEPLRSDAPSSVRETMMSTGTQSYRLWGDLLHSVQTGETAFEHIFGTTNWQYRAEHPEANAVFNTRMAQQARQRGRALVAAYDFPTGATVADIGGGTGTLLATILTANPSLRGILVDQPHVVTEAPATLQATGVADRCEVQGGDFFATLPAADVYTLSIVLHDWDDADALRILEHCRDALRPGGAVLLIEQVVPPGNAPHASKMTDLTMLLINRGGRERMEAEWRVLLERAGFVLRRILATSSPESVLEARLQDQQASPVAIPRSAS